MLNQIKTTTNTFNIVIVTCTDVNADRKKIHLVQQNSTRHVVTTKNLKIQDRNFTLII